MVNILATEHIVAFRIKPFQIFFITLLVLHLFLFSYIEYLLNFGDACVFFLYNPIYSFLRTFINFLYQIFDCFQLFVLPLPPLLHQAHHTHSVNHAVIEMPFLRASVVADLAVCGAAWVPAQSADW